MSRKTKFFVDEFYHIYNRGADKRKIFLSGADYKRFVGLLYLANSEKALSFKDVVKGEKLGKSLFSYERGGTFVDIGAYCLMPNHFHLLLKEKKEGGISSFVSKLCTAYSMYFNKKYEHSGTLFQGPFSVSHLDDDNYLKYMYSYIHLNPVKLFQQNWREVGIEDLLQTEGFLNNYSYSSYQDYLLIKRPENSILQKEAFPEYFSGQGDFKDFIEDWLQLSLDFENPEASPREVE